jgi:predicted house-cleaning noncanonical NTP pyrophosphatase (MazG superfamily)
MRSRVLFSRDLRGNPTASTSEEELRNTIGAKAMGLLRLPEKWTPPAFAIVSFPIDLIKAEFDRELAASAQAVLDGLSPSAAATLMVRSSGKTESLRSRGAYRSERSDAQVDGLVRAIRRVVETMVDRRGPSAESATMAVLIHEHLSCEYFGHLSNERRVGTIRHFLGEVWTATDSTPSNTFSLQSKKDVTQPSIDSEIPVNPEDIQDALRRLARWVHKQIGRAHLEWLVSANRLYVVQCDVEDIRDVAPPMSQWVEPGGSFESTDLELFRIADVSNSADLRKTRSRLMFQECGLPIAPVYVLRDESCIRDIVSGQISPQLQADLHRFAALPFVLRIDVVASGNEEWENLPASSVLRTEAEARAFLVDALPSASSRVTSPRDLAVVVHHFITARASAWAEAVPELERARIDATWGHPDGLQGFPCDSVYLSFPDNERFAFVRFKDEYLDVDASGATYRRVNGPPWDKQPTLEDADSRDIGGKTLRVAQHVGKPVRIMWFIGTEGRAGTPRCFPWIAVQDFATTADPFLRGDSTTPRPIRSDTIVQARRLALGAVRKIEVEDDIALFEQTPGLFDLGGQRVVIRPAASVVRSKQFIEKVGKAVTTKRWKLVLEGSTLAHAYYLLRAMGVVVESSAEYLSEPKRRKIYEKLVRDLIPQWIQARGEVVDFRRIPREQLRSALLRKLAEESAEAKQARSDNELLDELADVLEVVRALAEECRTDMYEINQRAERKRQTKGGFEAGVELIATGGSKRPSGTIVPQLDLFEWVRDRSSSGAEQRDASTEPAPLDEQGRSGQR